MVGPRRSTDRINHALQQAGTGPLAAGRRARNRAIAETYSFLSAVDREAKGPPISADGRTVPLPRICAVWGGDSAGRLVFAGNQYYRNSLPMSGPWFGGPGDGSGDTQPAPCNDAFRSQHEGLAS